MDKPSNNVIPLGRNMYFHSFALYGVLSASDWNEFLADATNAIGMSPVGNPATWNYPADAATGGNGSTIVQPITESFIAVDTWPDHQGAYFVVCSCRRFDPHELKKIMCAWKLRIVGEVGHALRIP